MVEFCLDDDLEFDVVDGSDKIVIQLHRHKEGSNKIEDIELTIAKRFEQSWSQSVKPTVSWFLGV